jgi:hypothetical protein
MTDTFAKIDAYDFGFVREHIANKDLLPGEDIVDDGPLAVIDSRVDEFWHCFVLFTPQYEAFCRDVLGFFLHHQPRTSSTDVPSAAIPNFVHAYRECFGDLREFWVENLPPATRHDILVGRVPTQLGLWSGWPGRR